MLMRTLGRLLRDFPRLRDVEVEDEALSLALVLLLLETDPANILIH